MNLWRVVVLLSLLSGMFSYRVLRNQGSVLGHGLSRSFATKKKSGVKIGVTALKSTLLSGELEALEVDDLTGTSTAKPKKQKKFKLKDVPPETLYVIDGTAMLFASFYSNENNFGYNDSYFTPEVTAKLLENMPLEAVAAVKAAQEKRSKVPNLHDYDVDLQATLESGSHSVDMSVSIHKNSVSPEDVEEPFRLRCGTITAMIMYFARLIREAQPKYVAVVFDAGRDTFRNKMMPSYKKTRQESPAELWPLFSLAPSIYESLGCKCFVQPGFEADDVMASLGRWARDRGLNVVHVSRDKDMLQLVDTGVYVMQTLDTLLGVDEVTDKYGVAPRELCDYQAIIGDTADNIPGVKGIGPKVAPALIRHFGSIEEMYRRLHLSSLPVPAEDTQALAVTDAKLTAQVKAALGKEKYAEALAELAEALKDVRAAAPSTLNRLYLCGHANALLYKELVTLKRDLPIQDCLYERNRNVFKFGGDLMLTESQQADVESSGELNSSYFLYNGENKLKHNNDVEGYFKQLSVSLLKPLQLLREQYHKLT